MPASGLSKLIFTNFDVEYVGDKIFSNNESRKGWFLINPILNKCYTANRRGTGGYTKNTRNMLLLKWYCAWTG